MRLVLDTNVLVSGLLSPHGPPARVLDLLTSGAITPLYDDRILQEYAEVLARPRFSFPREDVATLLAFLRTDGELIPALPLAVELPDPDDLPFLEVAATGAAHAVVTGNGRHFVATRGSHGVPVWSPAELLERMRGST